MATYKKRGKGWCIRWRNPGEKNPRRYQVPSMETAKLLCAEAADSEARGKPWVPPKYRESEVGSRTLDDLSIAWLKDRSPILRPSTIVAYSDSTERFIDFVQLHVGSKPLLSHLTRNMVKAFDRASYVHGLAAATRRGRLAALKSWANWIEAEYPENFRAAPIRAIEAPKPRSPVVLALPWEEIDAVIDRMRGKSRVGAMLARCTGLRRGAVTQLRWKNLVPTSEGGARLQIPDEITKGGHAGRIVPVAPVLARFLAEHRAAIKPAGADRIVPIRAASFGSSACKAFMAAAHAGSCRPEVLTVVGSTHLFRKAFVTNLRRDGADADAVERLVGHSLGIKAHYLDLDTLMARAVALVPPFNPPGQNVEESNVVRLHG